MAKPDKRKRRIDVIRDSPVSMEVGTPEEGSITCFVEVRDRLLVIKKHAIYEIKLADNVDPERRNPSIPNHQRCVLRIGSEAPLVGRTFMTANTLFKTIFLPEWFDNTTALEVAFDATCDLAALSNQYVELRSEIQERLTLVTGQTLEDGFVVPAIPDLEARFKALLQRADHFVKGVLDIGRLFYGDKLRHADSFLSIAKKIYANEDPFVQFLERAVPSMKLVRNMRNAIEHPDHSKRIIVMDFALQPDGKLRVPVIEVTHPEIPKVAETIIDFCSDLTEILPTLFEILLANLCAKHAEYGGFEIGIMELPIGQRREKNVRFSYAINLQGQWQPIS